MMNTEGQEKKDMNWTDAVFNGPMMDIITFLEDCD